MCELKIKTANTAIFFMIVSLLIFPLGGRSEIVFRLKLRGPKSVELRSPSATPQRFGAVQTESTQPRVFAWVFPQGCFRCPVPRSISQRVVH